MDFPQRVLIVDDDPIQRAVLMQVFTKPDSVLIEQAADGLDAISIVESSTESFDLIVLDLLMPNYDGIRFISYLESQNVKTRLLLVSGLPDEVVRMSHKLAEVGGLRTIGCLPKPLQLQDLLAIVGSQRWPRKKAAEVASDLVMPISHR